MNGVYGAESLGNRGVNEREPWEGYVQFFLICIKEQESIMYKELCALFEKSNKALIKNDIELFKMEVSERTLCGALMLQLHEVIKDTKFSQYNVDVEYNRNNGCKIKTICKTIKGPDEKIITINCDLILHSRGKNISQDNLIAVEMKKANRPEDEKEKDRDRLIALTKDHYDDLWSFDGITLPEHVCGYVLGVYYEIDFRKKQILIEYYKHGYLESSKELRY